MGVGYTCVCLPIRLGWLLGTPSFVSSFDYCGCCVHLCLFPHSIIVVVGYTCVFLIWVMVRVMMLNATFNSISALNDMCIAEKQQFEHVAVVPEKYIF